MKQLGIQKFKIDRIKYIEEDCQFRAIGITKTQSENNLGYKICDRLFKVGTIYENSELLREA